MIPFEEVKKYLPHYLSSEAKEDLFKDLKEFPVYLEKKMYSEASLANNIIYQGDGIEGLLVYNPPEVDSRPAPACVLSNSCDIDKANKRFFSSRILYCPIFKLAKYREVLIDELVKTKKHTLESIEAHISTIKQQFITQILYLPKGGRLSEDCIVFLDRINNFPLEMLNLEEIIKNKLFVLSDYGFYIFLIKLSIHFTRVQEGVSRPC